MRIDKDAQVTIFIIIAIVLVLLFGMVFYIVNLSREEKSEQKLRTQQRVRDLIEPVDEFVTECLGIAMATGLDFIGKQGGVIYRDQGGLTTPTLLGQDFVSYQDLKVGYGIYPPTGNVGNFLFSDPPQYPWMTFPQVISDSTVIHQEYLHGYFGKNLLPQLLRPSPSSIQEQLEGFVAAKVQDCVDPATFAPQGLIISAAAPPTATMDFQEQSISLRLSYPLEITSEVAGTTAKIDDFVVVYSLRMEPFFNFVRSIIDQDVTDISFTINQTAAYRVDIFRDVFRQDDIIVITDPLSVVAGIPYEFRFARHNRPPALEYIDEDRTLCAGSIISFTGIALEINRDACPDTAFSIPLRAWDPDEDLVTFEAFHREDDLLAMPYTVTSFDAGQGQVVIKVVASDGELTDSQEVTLQVS